MATAKIFNAIKQWTNKNGSNFSSEPLPEHSIGHRSLRWIYHRRWPQLKYSMRSSSEPTKMIRISLQKIYLNSSIARRSPRSIYLRRWPQLKYSMRSSSEPTKTVRISLQKISLNNSIGRRSPRWIYYRRWPQLKYSMRSSSEPTKMVRLACTVNANLSSRWPRTRIKNNCSAAFGF